MTPSNRAAWLPAAGKPLEIQTSPYVAPGERELTIKNAAASVNPCDHMMQDMGVLISKWPTILGVDVAGTVVEAGPGVTDFKAGDRVMSLATMAFTGIEKEGAWQDYVCVPLTAVCKIPDSMSFEEACVLPLCITTAAAGLYQQQHLAMVHPSLNPGQQGTVVIWGGSSSVGSCAIQLATASGYAVVAIASKRNFEYCKGLGAGDVFDYNSSTLVDDIVNAIKDQEVVGAFDAISSEHTIGKLADILGKAGSGKKIATVLPGTEKLTDKFPGVGIVPVYALTVRDNEVGPAIWKTFLPQALEQGKVRAKPEPLVVGKGLQVADEAMQKLRDGVSAQKIVFNF